MNKSSLNVLAIWTYNKFVCLLALVLTTYNFVWRAVMVTLSFCLQRQEGWGTLDDHDRLCGSAASAMIISSVLHQDEGSYRCKASNRAGVRISQPAVLTVSGKHEQGYSCAVGRPVFMLPSFSIFSIIIFYSRVMCNERSRQLNNTNRAICIVIYWPNISLWCAISPAP